MKKYPSASFPKVFLVFILFFSTYIGYSQSCTTGCSQSFTSNPPGTIIASTGDVICIRGNISRAINITGANVTLCIASGFTLSSGISFGGSAANLTINNFGTFSSDLNTGLPNNTIISNSGTWGGNINPTFSGGSITNSGTWNGNLNNGFTNGTLTNSGTWAGSISGFTLGTITNTGNWNRAMSNFTSGTFNNNNGGSYNTDLTLTGTSTFNHNAGASFTASNINININDNSTFNNYTTLNKPITLNSNGRFYNRSTGSINTTVTMSTGSTFINEGSATITNSNFGINGTFISSSGSTLNLTGNVAINMSGSLTVANNVTFQIGGKLDNNKTFSTQSSVTIGGDFTTNGSANSSVQGAMLTVNGLTTNNGTLNATNSTLTLKAGLTNNGNGIINLNNSLVNVTGNFVNNGTINNTAVGCVSIKVSGTSTNNGSGVFGTTGGSPTDICTGTSTGFTTNTGTLRNATTCSCSINPLPVTFISFTGTAINQTVVLKWQTADEKNNKEFVIERSADGKVFEPIATIAGQGTTNQLTAYQFTDTKSEAGYTYYRIKQIDFDNTESYYSKIVAVNIVTSASRVVLAPNPTADQYVVIRLSEIPENLTLTVMDIKGALRIHQKYTQPQTENQLSVEGLEKGIYVVMVQTNKQTETLRLVRL